MSVPPRAALPLAAGALALLLYSLTAAPDVGPVDSGELTLAASELGVPHPPGFPLYVLIGHVFAQIPGGSVAARLNLMSALFGALTAGAVALWTWLLLSHGDASDSSTRARRPRDDGATTAADDSRFASFGGIAAGLFYAGLRTPWAYATVAEVYTLAASLTVSIWLMMWHPTRLRMRAAAAVFGLALGTHPPVILSMLPALALLVAYRRGRGFFRTRELPILFLLSTGTAAAVFLYLPLAAAGDPVLNWGDASNLSRLWVHVSGWQYRGEASAVTLNGLAVALARSLGILADQFGGLASPGLLLVAIGLVSLRRRHPSALAILATWAATNVLFTSLLNAGWAGDRGTSISSDDVDAYLIPAVMTLAVAAGASVAALGRSVAARQPMRPAAAACVIVGGVAVAQPLLTHWAVNDRSDDATARNYADDALRGIAPGGLLLVRDWDMSSPLMYAQHVEGVRPDVVVLDLNLMERTWYLRSVARQHAALFADLRRELDGFVTLLARWEDDPSSIQRDPIYHRSLTDAFDALLLGVIAVQQRRAPAYVTFEVGVGRGGGQDSLTAKLTSTFQLVPSGIVFRLEPNAGFHPPPAVDLSTTPLLSTLARRRGADGVLVRMGGIYRDMLISRGLYFERNGRCDDARQAYDLALSIDSTSPAAAAVRERCRRGSGE
jgi:hypothetical protein